MTKSDVTRRALRCRAKFLEYFADGFHDSTYVETERLYKWNAHKRWQAELGRAEFERLRRRGDDTEIARRAVRIEASTNLLFSFEKIALRDAVSTPGGARQFVDGLDEWIHGSRPSRVRFDAWSAAIGGLPRRRTRVLTWPVLTVFGFIARPRVQILLKPNVTRRAAVAYGFPLHYASSPSWDTYHSLMTFARAVRHDLRDLRPRDMIDIQSFLWVQGSDEYR